MNDFELEIFQQTLEELESNVEQMIHWNESQCQDIHELFRLAHSIKGNSRSVDFREIEQVVHLLEEQLENLAEHYDEKPEQQAGFQDILTVVTDFLSDACRERKKDLESCLDPSHTLERLQNYRFDNVIGISQQEQSVSASKDSYSLQRILLVDDEPELLELIEELILVHFNVEIDTCLDGACALVKCREQTYDLIFSDLKMPNLPGQKFLEHMRNEKGPNQEVPVIILSGFRPLLDYHDPIWRNTFILEKPVNLKKMNFYIKCAVTMKKSA